jgi:hypothetical protein
MLQPQTNIIAGFAIKRRGTVEARRCGGRQQRFLPIGVPRTLFKTTFWYQRIAVFPVAGRPNSLWPVTVTAAATDARHQCCAICGGAALLLCRWWQYCCAAGGDIVVLQVVYCCGAGGATRAVAVDQPRPVDRKMELKDSFVSLKIFDCNAATGKVHCPRGAKRNER